MTSNYPLETSAVARPIIITPELILDYVGMTPNGAVVYDTRKIRARNYANSMNKESVQQAVNKPANRKETRQKWDWINVVTWSVVFAISTGVAVMMWKGLVGLFA